jgi:hypothetical protein
MSFIQNVEVDWTNFKVLKAGHLSTNIIYYLLTDLQYVAFMVYSVGTPGSPESVYFVNINRDPSSSGPYAALSSGVKAHVTIQDITYTANLYGTAGNSITVQYTNDATSVGQEYVTVSGTAITVHIVSGSSTAQQVLTAVAGWNAYNGQINKSQASAELLSAVISGASGNAQTTQGPTSLASGTAATTVLADWTANYLGSATLATSFANAIADELAA